MGWSHRNNLAALRRAIPDWLEEAENGSNRSFAACFTGYGTILLALDQRMTELDKQIESFAQEDPVASALQQLRGVGPLVATALVATVGDGKQYRKGRQMAAALGLTPRQHSSGERPAARDQQTR